MPEPTRLQAALADACEIARTYGSAPAPADFALQRSDPGWTHATYVDSDVVISVSIDPDDAVGIAVGEIDWVGADGAVCFNCGADDATCDCTPFEPMLDVPLPGDGTPPPAPEIPPYACRDEHGAIRRARDGLFILGPEATAATVAARIVAYNGNETPYANTMRTLYRGALELIESEDAKAHHEQFVAGLADRLDIEAGLDEVLTHAQTGPDDRIDEVQGEAASHG